MTSWELMKSEPSLVPASQEVLIRRERQFVDDGASALFGRAAALPHLRGDRGTKGRTEERGTDGGKQASEAYAEKERKEKEGEKKKDDSVFFVKQTVGSEQGRGARSLM